VNTSYLIHLYKALGHPWHLLSLDMDIIWPGIMILEKHGFLLLLYLLFGVRTDFDFDST